MYKKMFKGRYQTWALFDESGMIISPKFETKKDLIKWLNRFYNDEEKNTYNFIIKHLDCENGLWIKCLEEIKLKDIKTYDPKE